MEGCAVLNFDEARFLGIQSGAVGLAGRIDAIVSDALSSGRTNVHIVGAGGVAYLLQPAVELLRNRSTFPVYSDKLAELLAQGSANLNEGSLVFLTSLSGTTKESVAFLEFARGKGAKVVTMVGHADTPLGRSGDDVLVNFAADDTSCENYYIQSLLIALSIMRHRGEIDDYDALVAELAGLPQQLVAVKKQIEPKAEEFARIIAGSDYHIFTGAGNMWAEAHYYAMCILEEMQWIRTRPVHASDFFHGTLELVEKDVSVILFKGEDACRPLADRVAAFVPKTDASLTVLDTADFATEGLSPRLRALLSPALVATMLERISAHLEVLRNHPLSTRRYYRRVEY